MRFHDFYQSVILKTFNDFFKGFQYSPNTSPLANGIQVQVPNVEVPQQTRVMVNGWTVDEQIYKSKLWLKQRNQQMLHRSSK